MIYHSLKRQVILEDADADLELKQVFLQNIVQQVNGNKILNVNELWKEHGTQMKKLQEQ